MSQTFIIYDNGDNSVGISGMIEDLTVSDGLHSFLKRNDLVNEFKDMLHEFFDLTHGGVFLKEVYDSHVEAEQEHYRQMYLENIRDSRNLGVIP